ncbi:conserved hypothetical protein [Verticillium alfalfae VaMs.102]|uniref:PD-(D/E)XK nuclease-like domain-containing protein n=1 Tax=Verticillium alfalfae (strain VaMs.102 / ATCC MYA-4576 / FGSC 10136) TaxID=526221 RepID=C9SC30_VERA1|nr:conserved hypothetical protein [Verticillium alfalfae VaMs.102]EEY15914.1 conserved hypothetical protein [Verticillium alfalfae VaMs.102]
MRSATECDEMNEPECVWSDEVYRPILSWVLRPNDNESGLVDFRCSTSSRISRRFSPRTSTSKMVDFCTIFKPPTGSHPARRIDEICRTRPGRSINHSDAGALCTYPVGLSLEFKSPGADVVKAMVQIGAWHAAQWRSLCLDCPDSSTRAIEFLPGIIVQGHEWYFVATVPPQSPKAEDTSPLPFDHIPTLYSRILMGSTEHTKGLCRIVAALRLLVTWLEERYWPAFKQQVLLLDYLAPAT